MFVITLLRSVLRVQELAEGEKSEPWGMPVTNEKDFSTRSLVTAFLVQHDVYQAGKVRYTVEILLYYVSSFSLSFLPVSSIIPDPNPHVQRWNIRNCIALWLLPFTSPQILLILTVWAIPGISEDEYHHPFCHRLCA